MHECMHMSMLRTNYGSGSGLPGDNDTVRHRCSKAMQKQGRRPIFPRALWIVGFGEPKSHMGRDL